MNLTKCCNNHFYDGDKYKFCPYCLENTDIGDNEYKYGSFRDYYHEERNLSNDSFDEILHSEKMDPSIPRAILKNESIQIFGDYAKVTASFEFDFTADNEELIILGFIDGIKRSSISIKSNVFKFTDYSVVYYDESDSHMDNLSSELLKIELRLENIKQYMRCSSEKCESISELSKRLDEGEELYNKTLEQKKSLEQQIKYKEKTKSIGVKIHIKAVNGQKGKVFVSYLTDSIWWRPHYIIRGNTENDRISMGFCAEIHSSVAIDRIPLTISTGIERDARPYISDYIIKKNVRPAVRAEMGYRSNAFSLPKKSKNDVLFDSFETPELLTLPGVAEDSRSSIDCRVQSSEYKQSENYVLNDKITIRPLENKSVFLKQKDFTAEKTYLLTPKGTSKGFLFMKSKEFADYCEDEMIKSRDVLVEVFLDDELCREESTDTLAFPDNGIVFSTVEGITGNRKLLESKKNTNVINQKMVVKEKYRIEISNEQNKEAHVIVIDNIPVTKEDEVQIQLINTSGAEIDRDTGCAIWHRDIMAHGREVIDVEYNYSYPKKMDITIER